MIHVHATYFYYDVLYMYAVSIFIQLYNVHIINFKRYTCRSDGIPCTESLNWKEMNKLNRPVILSCPESTQDGNKIYIQVKEK